MNMRLRFPRGSGPTLKSAIASMAPRFDTQILLCIWRRNSRALGRVAPTPLCLLKDSLLLRRSIEMASEFDLVISANNECDLGGRGVQYVHYPRPDFDRPRDDLRWYDGSEFARRSYFRLCRGIARYFSERMAKNHTLVNADWIGARLRVLHSITATTVYPPVPGDFRTVPWTERANGFIAIGRISPEKRYENLIDLVGQIRKCGHDVQLHIVGTVHNDRYGGAVRRLVRERAEWVTLHEDIDRVALMTLAARQRYGLHAMVDEHFGIAIAEMIRAGCIVFVPRTGGPPEIVGNEPRLLFGSIEEARAKIVAVLADEETQASLCSYLRERAALFSTARFTAAVRSAVQDASDR